MDRTAEVRLSITKIERRSGTDMIKEWMAQNIPKLDGKKRWQETIIGKQGIDQTIQQVWKKENFDIGGEDIDKRTSSKRYSNLNGKKN